MIAAEEHFVARHASNDPELRTAEFLTRRLGSERKVISSAIQYLHQRSQNFVTLARSFRLEAGLLHCLCPDSPDIRASLRRMAWAVKSLCDLGSVGDGPVEVGLGDPRQRFQAARYRYGLSVGVFITGFYAAMATREKAVLDALAMADVDWMRPPGLLNEDYRFHWARALQGFHRYGVGVTHGLEESTFRELELALDGTAPERLKYGNTAAALFVDCLDMELMAQTTDDAEAFNGALYKALEQGHKVYYGQIEVNPGEDQSADPEGFVALGPLAFACAMHDRGWPITVKSDYLPISIVENR